MNNTQKAGFALLTLLSQIGSLGGSSDGYITESEAGKINWLTSDFLARIMFSVILEIDLNEYEEALDSGEIYKILAELASNSDMKQEALRLMDNATLIADQKEGLTKAFTIISDMFDIDYEPAISTRNQAQERLDKCKGFVNSIRVIMAMHGHNLEIPDYEGPDINVIKC